MKGLTLLIVPGGPVGHGECQEDGAFDDEGEPMEEQMPQPNEHTARMENPGKFEKIRSKELAPGVRALIGLNPGQESVVQSVHFNADKFTPQQARKWLKDHKKSPIAFEAARNGKGQDLEARRSAAARLAEEDEYAPGADSGEPAEMKTGVPTKKLPPWMQ